MKILRSTDLAFAQSIEREAQASVERVLGYFRDHGIDLGYIPTVKYTRTLLPFNPKAVASVDNENKAYRNMIGLQGAGLAKSFFRRFGVNLTDDTLHATIEPTKKEFDTLFPKGLLKSDETADILLYKPIERALDQLDEIAAHEAWHLVEIERGFFNGTDLIYEGSATYVENRLARRKSRWHGNRLDFTGTFHHNTAHLVEKEVGREKNPLLALLDSERRKAIQQKFERKILPMLYEKAAEQDEKEGNNFTRTLVLAHPAYEPFRKAQTAENLVHAFRGRGYLAMADELATQDLTKLVAHYAAFVN